MSAFDIIVIVLLSAACIAVVGTLIYKKVRHKGGGCGGCDCGCSGCSHCTMDCHKKDN